MLLLFEARVAAFCGAIIARCGKLELDLVSSIIVHFKSL
jgi:hypothetical protein